jgi:hypothetical protein
MLPDAGEYDAVVMHTLISHTSDPATVVSLSSLSVSLCLSALYVVAAI